MNGCGRDAPESSRREPDETDILLGEQNISNETPLPRVQLAVLCALRMLDPLSFSQIFPYINDFMADLHLTEDPSQIGFYSGLVESAFAISQLFAIYPWSWASDVIGRRPVIIMGVTGLTLTTILFGLSSNLTQVLISRTLAGVFTGNVAIIPSVLCEITDYSNQAKAFPIFGLFWPIGSIVGPLIGGSLSNPARKYGGLFDNLFFHEYPYFLPSFTAAMTSFVVAIASFTFLKESMPAKIAMNSPVDTERHGNYGATQVAAFSGIDKPLGVKQLLTFPVIRALCVSGFILSFITTAFDVLFVLFCYTPVQSGGLGFSVSSLLIYLF
ncbi:hypothetical protein HGRIS_013502 [Hohenbuehelia grisea]|uniref:Major facilitator superfamily (MFS) profile domain-containing protein n=1 Tax=Hohenbuehelia grisea TaxID=104357 RepID=A0ABR3IVV2_9AGAR